jgi:hypothetical protein
MSTEQGQLQDYMRLPAEVLYREELEALRREDTGRIPAGWQMSPRSVLTFIAGGKAGKTVITPKYIGNTRLIEMAVATLVTDRALLLAVRESGGGDLRQLRTGCPGNRRNQ